MRFGWFGFGSGALADADGMGEVAVAAERLGFESLWVGEHPVLIDPHEPPSPLPSRSEMMDPIPRWRSPRRGPNASVSGAAS